MALPLDPAKGRLSLGTLAEGLNQIETSSPVRGPKPRTGEILFDVVDVFFFVLGAWLGGLIGVANEDYVEGDMFFREVQEF